MIKFSIDANYIDAVKVDVVLLDVCGVSCRGRLYIYMRDAIFMRRAN